MMGYSGILKAAPAHVKDFDLKLFAAKRESEDKKAEIRRLEVFTQLEVENDAKTDAYKDKLSNEKLRKIETDRRLKANAGYEKLVSEIRKLEYDMMMWQIDRDFEIRSFWGEYALIVGGIGLKEE